MSRALTTAADHLTQAARHVDAASGRLAAETFTISAYPDAAAVVDWREEQLRRLVADVDAPGVGITATRAECERLAAAMATTVRLLEAAERDAEAHLGSLGYWWWQLSTAGTYVAVTAAAAPVGVLGPTTPVAGADLGGDTPPQPEGPALPTALVLDPAGVETGLASLDALGFGFGYEMTVASIVAALRTLDSAFGHVGDVSVQRGPSVDGTPPGGTSDIVTSVGELSPFDGGVSHTIAITEIEAPDGSRSWIVELPGTQDWIPDGGDNPMDATGNAEAIAGEFTAYMQAVRQAMIDAGIGADEPVMLAGHSQGGIVAMALVNNAAFASRFSVATVVTAGSPVAAYAPPAGGTSVHLENRTDLVPALDGKASPDEPNRITVSRDPRAAPAAGDGAAATSVVDAHTTDAYVGTAAGFDVSDSASALEWRHDNAGFFDQDATATRTQYRVERGA